MHSWASGPSSPWEELPVQTSALPSHLPDEDQLINCLSGGFTLSHTVTYLMPCWKSPSPGIPFRSVPQPWCLLHWSTVLSTSHQCPTIDTWHVLVPFHMQNGQMAFKFYCSCWSKQIHHTRFFELGVITLPTPSHLELMCVIRNLIVLVSVSSFLNSTFASLFYSFVLNIH